MTDQPPSGPSPDLAAILATLSGPQLAALHAAVLALVTQQKAQPAFRAEPFVKPDFTERFAAGPSPMMKETTAVNEQPHASIQDIVRDHVGRPVQLPLVPSARVTIPGEPRVTTTGRASEGYYDPAPLRGTDANRAIDRMDAMMDVQDAIDRGRRVRDLAQAVSAGVPRG